MRLERVSMSPSVRSIALICRENQSGRHRSVLHQKAIDLADQIRMDLRGNFPIIRHLADLPEALDRRLRAGKWPDVVLPGQQFEGRQVLAHRRAHQTVLPRMLAQATSPQAGKRREIEIRVAPLQNAHRIEGVVLQRLHGCARRRAGSGRWCRRCRRACAARRGRRSAPAPRCAACGTGNRRISCRTRTPHGPRRD